MRFGILAAGAMLAMAAVGTAWAQGDVIAERRAGLRGIGATMEAVGQAVQTRGDTRALLPRIDAMTAFFESMPGRFPVATLTPPWAQGTGEGQTRALAAIDADRAGFQTRATNMLTAIAALKVAAESGTISSDVLRSTGGTCGACHQQFRAR